MNNPLRLLALLSLPAALLFAMSCEQQKPVSPTTSTGPSQTTAQLVTEPTQAPEVEVADTLPAAQVRALFDRWLQSQNTQNFDDYSKLFADPFEGVRRNGARVYRFDREGWLKDRGRMFEKPMAVTATEVQIATSSASAVVTFVQTWSSGSYSDVGTKRLLVVKAGEQLYIAREELLTSEMVDGAAQTNPTYDPSKFAIVVDGRVLLDPNPKRAWEDGAAQLVTRPTTARKAAKNTGYEAWNGAALQLHTPDGEVCTVTTTGLELVARVVPHFGTVQTWDGKLTDDAPASDAQVAAQLWQLGTEFGDNVALFATVTPHDCEDAIWAAQPNSKTTQLPLTLEATGPTELAMQAFIDLPGYHTTQEDFNAAGLHGAWHLEGAERASRRFGNWVYIGANVAGPCGGFQGALWALWTATEGDPLSLETSEDGQAFFDVRAVLQHGDDTYMLDGSRVLGKTPAGWRVLWDASILDLDCHC